MMKTTINLLILTTAVIYSSTMFKLQDNVTNETVGCVVFILKYFQGIFITQFKQDQYLFCLVRKTPRGPNPLP